MLDVIRRYDVSCPLSVLRQQNIFFTINDNVLMLESASLWLKRKHIYIYNIIVIFFSPCTNTIINASPITEASSVISLHFAKSLLWQRLERLLKRKFFSWSGSLWAHNATISCAELSANTFHLWHCAELLIAYRSVDPKNEVYVWFCECQSTNAALIEEV